MRGLVWIVALAACAKQGGVQISVSENGTAAKTVRIFVGAGTPTKNATIVAAGGASHVGTYWFRDPAVGTDTATMTGSHVEWVFEPSGGATELPIIIAVGFDGNGAIVGTGKLDAVQVPDSGFLTYDIPLGPPGTAATWDAAHPTSTVDGTCVAIGAAKAEAMIVSPDDEDCDNFVDGKAEECEPLVYKATTARPALPGEFNCFDLSPAGDQCLAGGPTCLDGHGPISNTGMACPLSNYCAPGDLCAACTTLDCVPATAGMTAPIPRYECTIALEATAKGAKLCEEDLVLPAGAGKDCTDVRLRNAQQNFLPTLSVDSGRRSVQIDTHLKDCAIKLSPRGLLDSTGPNDPPDVTPIVALMAVDSVATPFSGFVAPIVFRFTSTTSCGPSTCTQIGGIGGTDRAGVCTAVMGAN